LGTLYHQVTITGEKLIVEPFRTPKNNFGLHKVRYNRC